MTTQNVSLDRILNYHPPTMPTSAAFFVKSKMDHGEVKYCELEAENNAIGPRPNGGILSF